MSSTPNKDGTPSTLSVETPRKWPVKITSFYRKKVLDEERVLGHRSGPLNRIVFPDSGTQEGVLDHEWKDPVGDRSNASNPESPAWIHKYRDRVLYLPTSRCLSNCQYCFRHEVLGDLHEQGNTDVLSRTLNHLLKYLNAHREVNELILSGGDPLMLNSESLDLLFSSVIEHTHVRRLRLHTKAPLFQPRVITDRKLDLLTKYRIKVVLHVTHPYEVCRDVEELLRRMVGAGVALYNQFPLLRRINDHEEVLVELLEKLDGLKVKTLSVFLPDPVSYSTPYRIPFQRMFELANDLRMHHRDLFVDTRFCQDTPYGKVRVEDFSRFDRAKGLAMFNLEGREVALPDFPEHLDKAGDPKVLLWRRFFQKHQE